MMMSRRQIASRDNDGYANFGLVYGSVCGSLSATTLYQRAVIREVISAKNTPER